MSNLVGTTWVFNDTPTILSDETEWHNVNGLFVCKGVVFCAIKHVNFLYSGMMYRHDMDGYWTDVYAAPTGWGHTSSTIDGVTFSGKDYAMITFIGEPENDQDAFTTWLEANAVQQVDDSQRYITTENELTSVADAIREKVPSKNLYDQKTNKAYIEPNKQYTYSKYVTFDGSRDYVSMYSLVRSGSMIAEDITETVYPTPAAGTRK